MDDTESSGREAPALDNMSRNALHRRALLGELPAWLRPFDIQELWVPYVTVMADPMHRHRREAVRSLIQNALWQRQLGQEISPKHTEWKNPPAGGSFSLSAEDIRRANGDKAALLALRTAPRPIQIPAQYAVHKDDFSGWLAGIARHLWPGPDSPLRQWLPSFEWEPHTPQHPSEVLEAEWPIEYQRLGTKNAADRAIADKYPQFTIGAVEQARKRWEREQRNIQTAAVRQTGLEALAKQNDTTS